jgi:hypothetical protein
VVGFRIVTSLFIPAEVNAFFICMLYFCEDMKGNNLLPPLYFSIKVNAVGVNGTLTVIGLPPLVFRGIYSRKSPLTFALVSFKRSDTLQPIKH